MAASNKTTLQDRCESYASGDRSSFDYKYCAWTLQRADKDGAATATADALAVADLDIRLCVRDLWAVVASLGRLSRVVGADVWIQGVRIQKKHAYSVFRILIWVRPHPVSPTWIRPCAPRSPRCSLVACAVRDSLVACAVRRLGHAASSAVRAAGNQKRAQALLEDERLKIT